MTGNFDLDTDLGLNGLGAVAATDKITARRSGVTGTVTASGLATYVSSVQATSYTVAAGGANFCPVYSDGTNWKIG